MPISCPLQRHRIVVAAPRRSPSSTAELLVISPTNPRTKRPTPVEQVAWLQHAQAAWSAERENVRAELDATAAALQSQTQDLTRRSRDVTAAEVRSQMDYDALNALRLRIEAERVPAESRGWADRTAEQHRRAVALVTRERGGLMRELPRLSSRCGGVGAARMNSPARRTRGRRAGRSGPSGQPRAVWLRAGAKPKDERGGRRPGRCPRTVAAGTVADAENSTAAGKGIERLRRQWGWLLCERGPRSGTPPATLAADAARLDEQAARLQTADRLDARIVRGNANRRPGTTPGSHRRRNGAQSRTDGVEGPGKRLNGVSRSYAEVESLA
ncbi:MAG: hypothetical protein U0746_21310 [Gemmataceae bacterium]